MESQEPEEAAKQQRERQILAVAETLEQSLEEHTKALAQVSRWKSRVAKWAMAAGIAAALAFGATGDAIWQIHKSQLNACARGNEFRAAQVQLWDHIIQISRVPPNETPAEKKARLAQIQSFRIYIHRQFRQLDCNAIYGSWTRLLH
jgi:hypothetical protein